MDGLAHIWRDQPGAEGTELIVDSFAGGGGASTGIEMALGRSPDIAINHDADALALHAANHPETRHLCQSVYAVDLRDHVGRRPIGLLWASPDCKHFSKAKGGRPVSKNIRDLAWVIVHWAESLPAWQRPRVIMLENVEEFVTWGPLADDGKLCPDRRGAIFERWVRALRRLGYRVEWRELRACDFGAPTIRKRFFLVARRDRRPIVWPTVTHGRPGDPRVTAGQLKPWRTAAEIIDWSIPCPSIFLTPEEARAAGVRRPLADATLRRIAKGVVRYVLEAKDPFVVTYAQHGGMNRSSRSPLHTMTASTTDQNAIVVPTLVQTGYGEREGQAPRVPGLERPLGTAVAGGAKHAVVAAFLAQHNGGMVGHDAREPVSTLTAKGCHQQVVAAHMMTLKGSDRRGAEASDPLRTVGAGGGHAALVSAFLAKYYGQGIGAPLDEPSHTVTTKDRFGLVTVEIDGATYAIADIGMRMLTPRELYRAQGFPDGYVIDRDADGRPITKTAQIRMCGNSVCPQLAAALVSANIPEMAASVAG